MNKLRPESDRFQSLRRGWRSAGARARAWAAASLLASGPRVWVTLILLAALFTTLLVLSNSSVHPFQLLWKPHYP